LKTSVISVENSISIIEQGETHFRDFKSIDIQPGKLTRTVSAFANADGGELIIGVEDDPRKVRGFSTVEDSNGHIQIFEKLFPLGHGFSYEFLQVEGQPEYLLKIEIDKSHEIVFASDKKAYLRRGAQNLPQTDDVALNRLKQNKGITSFETELVNVEVDVILNSESTQKFIASVVPTTTADSWFVKQRLIRDGRPTVAGVVLFADEPQACLPKRSGLKVYRYQTGKEEGERDFLSFDPRTVEGCAYDLIYEAVKLTAEIIEDVKVMTPEGLKRAKYPEEALHEIVTNAVLHRDYSVPDDIHIRIFDNRVEIQSPGLLPAHITPENIFDERFSRNGTMVRLINKFPNAPNKDVGEGLNTTVEAMKKVRLVAPVIEQKGMNVVVTLKHESLATPETLIMEYLDLHDSITNKQARQLSNVGSENAMKHILRRMVTANMLTVVKGKTVFDTSYVKKAIGIST
jgi:ATP-dependent DNA helicase RecG